MIQDICKMILSDLRWFNTDLGVIWDDLTRFKEVIWGCFILKNNTTTHCIEKKGAIQPVSPKLLLGQVKKKPIVFEWWTAHSQICSYIVHSNAMLLEKKPIRGIEIEHKFDFTLLDSVWDVRMQYASVKRCELCSSDPLAVAWPRHAAVSSHFQSSKQLDLPIAKQHIRGFP